MTIRNLETITQPQSTWTINGRRPRVNIPQTGPLVSSHQRPPAFMPGRAEPTPPPTRETRRQSE